MTEVTKLEEETKVDVEQVRIRERNSFEVINQIVEKYNASNGWTLKKVNMNMVNSIDVYLERSSKQADSEVVNEKTKKEQPKKVEAEVSETASEQEVSNVKQATTRAKGKVNSGTKPVVKEKEVKEL